MGWYLVPESSSWKSRYIPDSISDPQLSQLDRMFTYRRPGEDEVAVRSGVRRGRTSAVTAAAPRAHKVRPASLQELRGFEMQVLFALDIVSEGSCGGDFNAVMAGKNHLAPLV